MTLDAVHDIVKEPSPLAVPETLSSIAIRLPSNESCVRQLYFITISMILFIS